MELDDKIRQHEQDAYITFGDSEATIKYLSGFTPPNRPCLVVRNKGKTHILAFSEYEYKLAKESGKIAHLKGDFGFFDILSENNPQVTYAKTASNLLNSLNISSVMTGGHLPYFIGKNISKGGIDVEVVQAPLEEDRIKKTNDELAAIKQAQSAAIEAMKHVESVFSSSTTTGNEMYYKDDKVTPEMIQREIETVLAQKGCNHASKDPIVNAGVAGVDQFEKGAGDIQPNIPIRVDISPQHRSGYYGDFARTFCIGTPSKSLAELYEATHAAQNSGLDYLNTAVNPTGAELYRTVVECVEHHGYPIPDGYDCPDEGLVFSFVGHGIGCSPHEAPNIGSQTGKLSPGTIITIEPTLVDSDLGAVQIEDVVEVTKEGCRIIGEYSRNTLSV